jgi:hypothetical protein
METFFPAPCWRWRASSRLGQWAGTWQQSTVPGYLVPCLRPSLVNMYVPIPLRPMDNGVSCSKVRRQYGVRASEPETSILGSQSGWPRWIAGLGGPCMTILMGIHCTTAPLLLFPIPSPLEQFPVPACWGTRPNGHLPKFSVYFPLDGARWKSCMALTVIMILPS